jgi:Fe-S-cluster containining protein
MLRNRNRLRKFLARIEKKPLPGIQAVLPAVEKQVWKEINCLQCANCCKTMTPTYTESDIHRIAAFLNMSKVDFKQKWLRRERGGDRDWMNNNTPCQFLDSRTNLCRIYVVRPADCAGFPHLQKKLKDYIHVHKQNVELCPATYKMVEKIKRWANGELVISKAEQQKSFALQRG